MMGGSLQSNMEEEMVALEDNHTWEFVSLPDGKSVIGCKWVYVVKINPDGFVARLKARLVSRGMHRHTVYI